MKSGIDGTKINIIPLLFVSVFKWNPSYTELRLKFVSIINKLQGLWGLRKRKDD
jgi:hypothetical protein